MCNTKDPKVLMKSKSGKQAPFSPSEVEYMKQNGWTVIASPKAKKTTKK